MTKLDLLDVNERGDADFDALSEVEKGLYVLLLFFQLRDMEGITHFFSHHSHQLPCQLGFLAAAKAPNLVPVSELAEFLRGRAGGSLEPQALDEYFCRMSSEDNAKIEAWDREYDSRAQEMWTRVREYVRRHYDVDFD